VAEPKTLSILGNDFNVSMPYDAGHTLNDAEAKVLNQTRRENLSNNFRAKVKAFMDGAEDAEHKTLEELQAAFAELDSSYVFTLSTASAAVKYSPEEKEARAIARDYIKTELDKAGRKMKDVPEGMTESEWDDALEAEIARIASMDDVVKMAKDIVKARTKAKGLNLSTSFSAGDTEPAAA
jgi:hypothetical protein